MSYDPITFPFQVHNDAKRVERAYLVPEGLLYGATLEVTPAQADIDPGQAVIFSCRLTLDRNIIRPGCENDQGFRLTAWRVDEDADEQWGSCFYFIRPRVRTRLTIVQASWYETDLFIYGTLALDTDTTVDLASQLPLRVRVRLEIVDSQGISGSWVNANVQPGGGFTFSRKDFKGEKGAQLHVQAWFDRTNLLASSRSPLVTVPHYTAPVIG
jgi:hypothetical protein